ncbi:MAG: TolC family protein, partial [Methylibium sp.]|nr:TolC family protein [Methylibium sp.]
MRATALLIAVALAGCATAIDTTRPTLDLPLQWNEATTAASAQLQRDWWRGFQSDELARLIDAAQAGSPTLAIAAERVQQAEIAVRSAGATLFPSVSVSGSSGARRADPGPGFDASTAKS